ncbi:hypothetical protein HAX54_052278, partial [Datura stramonium]|nr:hypothetical protein [Datura stramonium]
GEGMTGSPYLTDWEADYMTSVTVTLMPSRPPVRINWSINWTHNVSTIQGKQLKCKQGY